MSGKLGGYSVSTPQLIRDCDVSTEGGDSPTHSCTFNKVEGIQPYVMSTLKELKDKKISLSKANEWMTAISQLLFESVYWSFSFGGNIHGVHGSLPIELLHAFLL